MSGVCWLLFLFYFCHTMNFLWRILLLLLYYLIFNKHCVAFSAQFRFFLLSLIYLDFILLFLFSLLLVSIQCLLAIWNRWNDTITSEWIPNSIFKLFYLPQFLWGFLYFLLLLSLLSSMILELLCLFIYGSGFRIEKNFSFFFSLFSNIIFHFPIFFLLFSFVFFLLLEDSVSLVVTKKVQCWMKIVHGYMDILLLLCKLKGFLENMIFKNFCVLFFIIIMLSGFFPLFIKLIKKMSNGTISNRANTSHGLLNINIIAFDSKT